MFKFIKIAKAEIKNITWPNRKTVINYSLMVVLISILLAVYLYISDTVLKQVVLKITEKTTEQTLTK